MLIRRLQLQSFRCFATIDLLPAPGFNLVTGDNGSGKTSVLEAVHLMGHGRSFRGRVRDGLVRHGDPALQVVVEWQAANGNDRRAGLRHSGSAWEARLDGGPVAHLGELCAALAVVSFEPGSHALVEGGGDIRRRYVDWGLFHVEPAFLPIWRRYARALKQRNALLRQGDRSGLDAWEHELGQAGEALAEHRDAYAARLQPHFEAAVAELLPAAGAGTLSMQPGWRRQDVGLTDALLLARERDRQAGHTTLGPHRADLRLILRDIPGREALSRGQAKLVALALLLAQARHLAGHAGDWPVLQLDDLGAELDRKHQARVLHSLAASGAQVFVTGTEVPAGLEAHLGAPAARFHVEHGTVSRMPG